MPIAVWVDIHIHTLTRTHTCAFMLNVYMSCLGEYFNENDTAIILNFNVVYVFCYQKIILVFSLIYGRVERKKC